MIIDYKGENERSEWRQDYIQLPNTGVGVANELPYTQIDRLLSARKIGGQTNPFIKVPAEVATGEYTYTGMPIESPLDYLANQFSYSKYANNTGKQSEDTRGKYLAGQLSGFPVGKM